ncbi:MAG TPA: hypothetical protein EYP47_01020 [Methanococcaceae archaeon]|uniref:Uncharacterized protein n=1 Tax=Methanothermococcus okinawensis TaxID=155863 RepID=A0A833E471_9EURY|nr:hypothetical protein [Methanococcaceae archaeon]HIP91462.1 hypothetical protein [Methanothermococcus okinawensis]
MLWFYFEFWKNIQHREGKEIKNEPREKILEMLKDIVTEFSLWDVVIGREDNLLEECSSILKLILYERKNIYTFKSFLKNRFLKNSRDEEILSAPPILKRKSYILYWT